MEKVWNLKESASRLLWRFKSKKGFTPNDNDINALNSVLKWINNQKKETLNNNHLFAKLYIYHLTMNIRYYETTVMCPTPQQDLHKILDYPLEYFYKSFINDLYNNQLNRLLDKETNEEKQEIIKEYIEQKDLYPEEYIINNLNHMITEALNKFN